MALKRSLKILSIFPVTIEYRKQKSAVWITVWNLLSKARCTLSCVEELWKVSCWASFAKRSLETEWTIIYTNYLMRRYLLKNVENLRSLTKLQALIAIFNGQRTGSSFRAQIYPTQMYLVADLIVHAVHFKRRQAYAVLRSAQLLLPSTAEWFERRWATSTWILGNAVSAKTTNASCCDQIVKEYFKLVVRVEMRQSWKRWINDLHWEETRQTWKTGQKLFEPPPRNMHLPCPGKARVAWPLQ